MTTFQSHAALQCSDVFKSTQSKTNSEISTIIDETALEKEVQIIWYPNSKHIAVTHAELNVNGVIWDGFTGFKQKGSAALRERLAQKGGRGYVAFHLKVSEKELQNISEFLKQEEGKTKSLQSCISGACSAITKNSGIVIPFPFSQVPTLAAAYLAVSKHLGYQRVVKIEWVGVKDLSTMISIQPAYELSLSLAVGAIVISVLDTEHVNYAEHMEQFVSVVVPIFQK